MLRKIIRTILTKVGRKTLKENICLQLKKFPHCEKISKGVQTVFHLPPVRVDENLDLLLLELPPRYIPMIPNGIGHLYNVLKKSPYKFQLIDFNIYSFRWFHQLPSKEDVLKGLQLMGNNVDPWDNTNVDFWQRDEMLNVINPILASLIEDIIKKRPRSIGISLNGSNRHVAKVVIRRIKESLPEIVIIVGGYDCVYHSVGPYLFSDFDYMAIGEAEETILPLLEAIHAGRRTFDLPGIVSKYDSQGRVWMPKPGPADLDAIGYPRYEWTNLEWYRDLNNNPMLMPITSSRGCKWGRCRFCGECFSFRKRSPIAVVDEIEFLHTNGFNCFHFNESDVNGDPENLYNICSEVIRRNLSVSLMGQLRIDKCNTPEYMKHLAQAGFKHLRFGVDGWSDQILKLQRKGYNMKIVADNLRATSGAKIYTTVNIVIGVPGEREEDVDEAIKNMIALKPYIACIESFNTLLLIGGSEYYKRPSEYGIIFRGNADEIKKEHPHIIPPDLWYSENPYIDQHVRLARLEKICQRLFDNDVTIGPFAKQVIKGLRERKDANA